MVDGLRSELRLWLVVWLWLGFGVRIEVWVNVMAEGLGSILRFELE